MITKPDLSQMGEREFTAFVSRALDEYEGGIRRLVLNARDGNPWARNRLWENFSCRLADKKQLAQLNKKLRRGDLDHRRPWL